MNNKLIVVILILLVFSISCFVIELKNMNWESQKLINRTAVCGDLICQRDGNDFGIKEDYWNCQQDCTGAVGENLDKLVYFITTYCFDVDIETLCFWTQGFSKSVQARIKAEEEKNNSICGDNICQSNENSFTCQKDCLRISMKTLVGGCLDKKDETACFWKTNLAYYLLFGVGAALLLIPMIKDSESKKRISSYKYLALQIKKKRRKKYKPYGTQY